jgi:phosphodiesterase/alkaline phosphatase D-like protein
MLEARPTLMSWDDHDITEGWGALIEWDELDMRVFRAAEATYREYQHVRHIGASVEEQATYHRSFWFGDVGFFVLDREAAAIILQDELDNSYQRVEPSSPEGDVSGG